MARRIAEAAAEENRRYAGAPGSAGVGSSGLGSVGLVVGATIGTALVDLGLDLDAVHGPILAPGLGAQGATPADLRATFGAAYPAVLATSSRGILAAGPTIAGLRSATESTRDGLLEG